MEKRKCPVCRIFLILRQDMRTCSVECSRTWNKMSIGEKGAAIESASESWEDTIARQEYKKAHMTQEELEERALKKEELAKILSKEAPKPGPGLDHIFNSEKELSEQEQREIRREQMVEALKPKKEVI